MFGGLAPGGRSKPRPRNRRVGAEMFRTGVGRTSVAAPKSVVACDSDPRSGTPNRRFEDRPGGRVQLAHQAGFSVGLLDVRPSTREVVWAGGREVLQPR